MFDTREAPSSYSKQQFAPYFEQPVKDLPIPDEVNISNSEDTNTTHIPKIKIRLDWLKPVLEEDIPEISEPDWIIPPTDLPVAEKNWADALAKSYKDPEENKLLSKTKDVGSYIKWFCKRIGKKKISKSALEVDLVNSEGHRLVPDVNKMLLLGGPPRQTKLNLTEPRWDALEFLFKQDYTIISKQGSVIYRDRNDQKKILRENEVHKFSDGTLTRVLHNLDHMVKDFRLYQYNMGMENII
nr:hypothetical protein [Tanacetum cinerariifolium]